MFDNLGEKLKPMEKCADINKRGAVIEGNLNELNPESIKYDSLRDRWITVQSGVSLEIGSIWYVREIDEKWTQRTVNQDGSKVWHWGESSPPIDSRTIVSKSAP